MNIYWTYHIKYSKLELAHIRPVIPGNTCIHPSVHPDATHLGISLKAQPVTD